MPAPSILRPASPYDTAVFAEAGAREVGGQVVTVEAPGAQLRALARRRGPFRVLAPPPLAFYHAPALASWPSEAEATDASGGALGVLLDALQARADAVSLALPPGTGNGGRGVCPPLLDARPLAWRGFVCEVRYTYRLATPDADAVRRAMRPSTRRTLPPIPEALDKARPADLAAAVVAAYTRHDRSPPLPEAALARIAETCVARGAGRLVRVGEAMALVLGLDTEGPADDAPAPCLALSSGPGLARLVWAIAADVSARGHRVLDLIGANTPSIAEGKRRLGATLVPYVRATWHRPGLARMVAALRPLV